MLYQVIEEYWPEFQAELAGRGKSLPAYITKEFEEYLKCGRLEHGFLRVRCEVCHDEKLVAFSCKRRGFCPSCGARRMAESATLLVDAVLPHQPMRQWVLSVPFPLRYLFASRHAVMGRVATSIFPLEVVKGDEVIYVNYGRAILNVGDRLTAFAKGEKLTDEATGIHLGSEEEEIATVEIFEVTDTFSKARLLSGTTPMRGALLRLKAQGSEPASGRKPGEKRGKKLWGQSKGTE